MTKKGIQRRQLSEDVEVNRRRHLVLAWMLAAHKIDGHDVSAPEMAEALNVSLGSVINDQRIVRQEFADIFKHPEVQLEVVDLLQKASGYVEKNWTQAEELYDETKRAYDGDQDKSSGLRGEMLAILNVKMAMSDKVLAIVRAMHPSGPAIPPGSQLINVHGDLHQAGQQQFVTFNALTELLAKGEKPGTLPMDSDESFVDMSEDEIGKMAGSDRDVNEPSE